MCILMGHNYDDDRLATQMSFRFPQFTATPLAQLVPSASHDAVVLMQVPRKYHASSIMFYALYISYYSKISVYYIIILPCLVFVYIITILTDYPLIPTTGDDAL